jgi:hypothetical protein
MSSSVQVKKRLYTEETYFTINNSFISIVKGNSLSKKILARLHKVNLKSYTFQRISQLTLFEELELKLPLVISKFFSVQDFLTFSKQKNDLLYILKYYNLLLQDKFNYYFFLNMNESFTITFYFLLQQVIQRSIILNNLKLFSELKYAKSS